jgi:hypothetical protein
MMQPLAGESLESDAPQQKSKETMRFDGFRYENAWRVLGARLHNLMHRGVPDRLFDLAPDPRAQAPDVMDQNILQILPSLPALPGLNAARVVPSQRRRLARDSS